MTRTEAIQILRRMLNDPVATKKRNREAIEVAIMTMENMDKIKETVSVFKLPDDMEDDRK